MSELSPSIFHSPDLDSWAEGIQLAEAMKYQFLQFSSVGLAKIIPSASEDAIGLILVSLLFERLRDQAEGSKANKGGNLSTAPSTRKVLQTCSGCSFSGDQLAKGKKTSCRFGMGTNMYPSSVHDLIES